MSAMLWPFCGLRSGHYYLEGIRAVAERRGAGGLAKRPEGRRSIVGPDCRHM